MVYYLGKGFKACMESFFWGGGGGGGEDLNHLKSLLRLLRSFLCVLMRYTFGFWGRFLSSILKWVNPLYGVRCTSVATANNLVCSLHIEQLKCYVKFVHAFNVPHRKNK